MSETIGTMFATSPSTAKLDAALAKAQGEVDVALKNQPNAAFKQDGKPSKYANLTAIWEAARKALADNHITFTQWPLHSTDNRVHMITRVSHAGEWMQGEFSIPVEKPNAHGHGSAVTYLRRFCMGSVLGIVTEEDDDGNAASNVSPKDNGIGHWTKGRSKQGFGKIDQAIIAMNSLDDICDYYEKARDEHERYDPEHQGLLLYRFIEHGFKVAESVHSITSFWNGYFDEMGAKMTDEQLEDLVAKKRAAKERLATSMPLKEQLTESLNGE